MFANWIGRLSANLTWDTLRDARRRSSLREHYRLVTRDAHEGDLATRVMFREDAARLERAREELSTSDRRSFDMFYMECADAADIATALRISLRVVSRQRLDPGLVYLGQKIQANLCAVSDPGLARDAWKQVIEEDAYLPESLSLWSALRAGGRDVATPYGLLVSDHARATEVLSKPGYSVSEYARRMNESMGLHYLGREEGVEYRQLAEPANGFLKASSLRLCPHAAKAINSARQRAHELANEFVTSRDGKVPGAIIDVRELAAYVVARLADEWVGLPTKLSPLQTNELIRAFVHISRYCFPAVPHRCAARASDRGRHGAARCVRRASHALRDGQVGCARAGASTATSRTSTPR